MRTALTELNSSDGKRIVAACSCKNAQHSFFLNVSLRNLISLIKKIHKQKSRDV